MSLLTAKDFPRWTRAKLGLPTDANLSEEIDRVIIRCENHLRSILGDAVYEDLAANTVDNANRRQRFEGALHAFVESELHEARSEHLGSLVGSSTQGKRSRTVAVEAVSTADMAAERSRRHYVEGMFALGHTVRPEAIGFHYTSVTR